MQGFTRPEIELLLCCASPVESGERAERIRALAGQPLDWDYLVQTAAAHGVVPLLYWRLKAFRPEAIPAELALRFQENTRNSVHLSSELLQLMKLFEREGIRALPFKGPTLAVAAYGNLALRKFKDLDLFVARKDALRARKVLLANGYRTDLLLRSSREQDYLRVYDEFGLLGSNGSPLVELHWEVTPRYFAVPLDIAEFWSRASSVALGGRETPALGTDDLLLALCLHAAKHCWQQLSMVTDIAWVIARCTIGWEAVLERARAVGGVRMVLLGSELAGRLLEAPVPPAVAQTAASDPAVQKLAAEVTGRIFLPRTQESTILKAGSFHMRSRERWRDRARYFVRMATTAGIEDWQAMDLPAQLTFLYPVLRVPRLLRKYWMRVP